MKSRGCSLDVILTRVQAIFQIIDYSMRWIQARLSVSGRDKEARRLEHAIGRIPSELLTLHAKKTGEHERVLFYAEEQYRRMSSKTQAGPEGERLADDMIEAASNMDEPDTFWGFINELNKANLANSKQAFDKLSRWDLSQVAHQTQVMENPEDTDSQVALLNCYQKSGQYGT